MNAPEPRPAEIPALTGVRALAAVWVVTMHFWEAFLILVPSLGIVTPLISQGNFGVDFFFLLSGMIMMHVYGSLKPFGFPEYMGFLGRRLARIYPGYLFVFLVMIGLVAGASMLGVPHSEEMYPVASLPFEFAMVQAWGPSMLSWNYPDWSVSAEWFAYLLIFPVALFIFRTLWAPRGNPEAPRLAGTLAGVGLLAGLVLATSLAPRTDGLPHPVIRVSFEFLAGAMLYRVLVAVRKKSGLGNALLLIGGIGIFLRCWGFWSLSPDAGWFVMLSALSAILLGVGIEGTVGARILAGKPWVYLGEISYALYLSHAPVQRVLKVLLPEDRFADSPAWIRAAVAITYLAVMLGAAMALYHVVERPARKHLIRRMNAGETAGRRKAES